MATHNLFKGIKRVLATNTAYTATTNNDYLYFVRTATTDLEGDIWFQGVHYGHFGEHDLDAINTALEGFLPGDTGYTNQTVKEYIDDAIAELEAGFDSTASGESADGHVSVKVDMENGELTAVTVTTSDIASATALTAEETARESADTALQTEIDAIETAVGLSTGGTYVAGDGQFTSAATSVADAIDKLDDALASAVTDIETEIENKINALDADESGSSTYVNVRVQEENGVITEVSVDDSALEAAIEAMDLAEVHEAGKAIIAVSEEDGKVSASAGTVAAQYVDVADAAGHFDASNVEAALAELYTGYTAGDAALLGDATESGNTLGKLEDRIEALATDAKEYHLVEVTTGLPAETKVEYKLVDAEGNQSGDTISIPKDSHIVEINYITDSGDPHYQNLEYVYIDVCGATKTEYVDMSQLILEQEFASGITSTDGVAHGVVDPASEDFLTVGADGFKLSGVQDAIDAAVSAETEARENADDAIESALTLTAQTLVEMIENAASAATTEVVEGTDAGNNLSIAETAGADEHKIYTINLTDVASASALTQEISDRADADADIQAELNAVESELGFDGTAYTQSGENYVISGDTVAADIKRLDTGLGVLNDNLADVESDLTTAITAEASARTQADEALQDEIDAIEEKYLTGVTVNGVNATVSNNAADVTIDAGDVEIGTPLTGTSVTAASGDTVDEVLQAIIDNLDSAVAGSYTGVTSSDESLLVTENADHLGQNVVINKEEASLASAQDGHIFLEQVSGTGETANQVYAAMYWIDAEDE